MDATEIVIADDHHVVRRGVRALLDDESDFRVLADAKDGLEACDMVERLKPDVLVLDVMMPGLNGLEVTRRVSKISPKTRVVILSMHDDQSYVWEALKAGARAYVLKTSTPDELVHAIRQVTQGQYHLNQKISEFDVDAYREIGEDSAADPYEQLTPREREVLQLAADGCDRVEIAKRLFISPRTAEAHRASAMHKLGLRTKSDLIRYALKRGILAP
ncbi:MAG: response regulator transcription factor [Chloroflexi bacterium]|nr:response regulator transcription factor [Chloroflexota bacterium]